MERATKGRLTITLHPDGAMFSADEIKRAVQAGKVAAGEFILSGAADDNPLFGIDSIPFLATSYGDAPQVGQYHATVLG